MHLLAVGQQPREIDPLEVRAGKGPTGGQHGIDHPAPSGHLDDSRSGNLADDVHDEHAHAGAAPCSA